MTDQEIRTIAYACGFQNKWNRPGYGPDLHDYVYEFARAILAASPAAQPVDAESDNLRDQIGQAISDAIGNDPHGIDFFDSREIDRIADAVVAVLPALQAAQPVDVSSQSTDAGNVSIDTAEIDTSEPASVQAARSRIDKLREKVTKHSSLPNTAK